eukprot:scaffold83987_cov49-Phaeocystis_antarctica.AAC.2
MAAAAAEELVAVTVEVAMRVVAREGAAAGQVEVAGLQRRRGCGGHAQPVDADAAIKVDGQHLLVGTDERAGQ